MGAVAALLQGSHAAVRFTLTLGLKIPHQHAETHTNTHMATRACLDAKTT